MYYTIYHTFGWVDTPDGNWSYRFLRGAFAGSIGIALQKAFNVGLTSYQHIRSKYHAPLTLNDFKLYLQNIKHQEYYRKHIRREVLYGLSFGAFDMGIRLAVFRFLTEGINEADYGFNTQIWRKPLPIFLAGLLTCWTKIPFEIAHKAFHAD